MSLSWYPGHMAKTRFKHQTMLKTIDVIFWMVDARAPFSTLDPTLKKTFNNKPFLVVINKKDVVNEAYLNHVLSQFNALKMPAIAISARNQRDVKTLITKAQSMQSSRRKIGGLRVSVLGIPNTGKSTLINQLAKKKTQPVANTPGVTKAMRWVETPGVSILDTPGVLWPKIDDPMVGLKMAILGSIKDKMVPYDAAVEVLLKTLNAHPDSKLKTVYQLTAKDPTLLDIASSTGFNHPDGTDFMGLYQRILKDYREGKLGHVPLDV